MLAALDDGKLSFGERFTRVPYVVVTCPVPSEFKSGDEILSICSICIVRFSGAVGKVLSL